MADIDLSTIVLQITALNSDAVTAFKHPHNEAFLVPSISSDLKPVYRRARETTPLTSSEPVRAVLRTNGYPFDPLLGWVFGRDEEVCDFILGTRAQGVSQKHFRVDHNWKAKTLVLTNMSGNGISWTNPETGESERILSSRVILPGEQYSISAGGIDLVLRIPHRSDEQQAVYNKNIEDLRLEVQNATPTMNGLRVQTPGIVTPMIVGSKRKYALQNIVGTGAMALVHKAVDLETGDIFAAKEYKLDQNTKIHLSSMLNEIKILQRLKHRNIIEYTDLFRDPDPILIMELAIKSLDDVRLTRTSDCVALLKDASAGLAYLHGEKIIHRDIKPGNILLTRENPVLWKLSDFGLSKMAEVTTTFVGTPIYLAPEMGGAKYGAYTAAVDIWALGIVGLEHTSGIPPKVLRLLQDRTKRQLWNDAIIKQVQQSPLAQYLELMLDPVPTKRPLAHDLLKMLEVWDGYSDEILQSGGYLTESLSGRIPNFRATAP